MSDSKMVKVVIEWDGETSEISELPDTGDRVSNVALASLEVRSAFDKFVPSDLAPQPRLLMVVRAFGEAFNGGRRDQRFEDDVMQSCMATWGMKGFAEMMSAEPDLIAEAERIDDDRMGAFLQRELERERAGGLDAAPTKD